MKTELSQANLKEEFLKPWEMLPRNVELII